MKKRRLIFLALVCLFNLSSIAQTVSNSVTAKQAVLTPLQTKTSTANFSKSLLAIWGTGATVGNTDGQFQNASINVGSYPYAATGWTTQSS
ncbi:hypothetical protein, partial [Lishizhenia sp.]|uniref:hypothetical protein n=1 Tax=Lishizhenia sp. TaxID=2497594 RepID=UPI00299D6718